MKNLYSYSITNHSATSIEWQKSDLLEFDELIISWNATRPKIGNFLISFSIQTKEKIWLPFMPYASWGSLGQKSYTNKSAVLEVEQDIIRLLGCKAIGFCICIKAEEGAGLIDMHALHASAANLSNHSMKPLFLPNTSVRLAVEPISQMTIDHPRKKHMCSPAATCSVVNYLIGKRLYRNNLKNLNFSEAKGARLTSSKKGHCCTTRPFFDEVKVASQALEKTDSSGCFGISPLEAAENIWDSSADIYGNWVFGTACASHYLGPKWHVAACRLNSFDAIAKNLTIGIPSVVSLRGQLLGAPQPYSDGHLVAVTGFDSEKGTIFCMDPAFEEPSLAQASYQADDFFNAWSRRGGFTYLFKNCLVKKNCI